MGAYPLQGMGADRGGFKIIHLMKGILITVKQSEELQMGQNESGGLQEYGVPRDQVVVLAT